MIGKTVSHYRILEKLGEGGMGAVYKAEDIKLKRTIALKFLPPEMTRSGTAKQRFVREAQVAASLEHPNVCTIHEIEETGDGQLFICMAYCTGEPLASRLKRGPLELNESVDIAIGIARGLAEAHSHGIIHRDIKPSNVMIADQNEVKILDFGIAKHAGDPSITSTGLAVGTPAYMAPEQAAGMEIDRRADIWSLGVVLYRMVSGDLPFRESSTPALLQAICGKEPEPIALRIAGELPGIQEIIDKCLAKKRDDRYQDVSELLEDLEAVWAGVRVEPRKRRSGGRRRVVSIGAVAAVGLIALALFLWLRGKDLGDLTGGGMRDATQTLAVLDFENLKEPEDAERLGQILQELVITDLSDISSLNVLSSQRLLGVQKKLGYTSHAKINREVAEEVSRLAGASRMLSGTIMQLGERWILASQLIDVADGAVIKSQRIDGSDIYAMVDELSRKLRADLRLPSGSGSYVDVSVRDKTTTSMDAYRHYLNGVELLNASALSSSIAEFQKAVEIDPTFNQAYYKMALAQWWSDDVTAGQGRESIAHILEGKRYASDKERWLAEGALALIDQRFTDALSIYEDLVASYPDDKEVYFVLGLAYFHESTRINRDKALAAFQKAIDLDLTFVLAYRGIYDIYMAEREFTKATELANNLITLKPDSPVGYRFLVEAAICRGDTAQINLTLEEALQHHETPEELKGLYYHMGLAYNRVRDEPRSELYTRKALEYDPDGSDYRILAQLGDALLNQGKIDEAKHYYQKGLDLNPLSSWCLGGLWYVAIDNRDYDKAIDCARRLVELRPQSPRRHADLFDSYAKARRWAEAESILVTALAAIPSEPGKMHLLLRAAETHMSVMRYDRAEALLLRAKELDPLGEAPDVNLTLATVAIAKREFETAEHYAREVLAGGFDDPYRSAALHALFHSYLYRGRLSEAREVAQKRIDTRPRVGMSFSDLAELYLASGEYGKADSLLQIASGVDSVKTPRHTLFGEWADLYRRAGELDKAEEAARRALDYKPDDKWLIRSLGLICELRGQYGEAERHYRTSLESWSANAHDLRSLGRLYWRQGRITEAVELYRQALEIDEQDPRTLRELSVLLARAGKRGEAEDYAERALEGDPSFFSCVTMAWVLIDGDSDIARGMQLAQTAATTPPLGDPTDDYVNTDPLVPLLDHVQGLAYMKQGDFQKALPLLQRAAGLRPDDDRIARDLESARRGSEG